MRLTVERDFVRRGAQLLGHELVECPRVTDFVLRDRGEGDVLLEERRDAGPLGVAPPEDELVVSYRQQELCPRVHEPP
jgi:hypothetical protein